MCAAGEREAGSAGPENGGGERPVPSGERRAHQVRYNLTTLLRKGRSYWRNSRQGGRHEWEGGSGSAVVGKLRPSRYGTMIMNCRTLLGPGKLGRIP